MIGRGTHGRFVDLQSKSHAQVRRRLKIEGKFGSSGCFHSAIRSAGSVNFRKFQNFVRSAPAFLIVPSVFFCRRKPIRVQPYHDSWQNPCLWTSVRWRWTCGLRSSRKLKKNIFFCDADSKLKPRANLVVTRKRNQTTPLVALSDIETHNATTEQFTSC